MGAIDRHVNAILVLICIDRPTPRPTKTCGGIGLGAAVATAQAYYLTRSRLKVCLFRGAFALSYVCETSLLVAVQSHLSL